MTRSRPGEQPHPGSGPEQAEDRRLLVALSAGDPARGMGELSGAELAERLEQAMAQTPDGWATRASGARHRSPLTWAIAAATVVVLAGLGWTGLRLGSEDVDAPQAEAPAPAQQSDPPGSGSAGDEPGDGASPEPDVLALGLPAASSARCMVPSAAALANQELALEGRVESVEAGVVRLAVERWYRGEESAVVELPEVDETLRRAVAAPEFVVGRSYLVSATDDRVTLCGFTDRARPALRDLYDQAFGTPR